MLPSSSLTVSRLLCAGALTLLVASSASSQTYRATYLGNYSDSNFSVGNLNSSGYSVLNRYYSENGGSSRLRGSVTFANGNYRTLGWLKDGSGTNLYTAAFDNFSATAFDINDSGVVVGSAKSGTSSYTDLHFQDEPYKVVNGVTTRLSSPSNSLLGFSSRYGASATGVNNAGEVVGTAEGSGPGNRDRAPLYWNSAGDVAVLALPGNVSYWAHAFKINDDGVIVGSMEDNSTYVMTGLIWRSGTPSTVGTFGGLDSEALGINQQWIVGYADDGNGYKRAFRMGVAPGSAMTNLGSFYTNTDSIAYDVNSTGTVVGTCHGDAFVWSETGGMQNLGNLDDVSVDYDEAIAINDRGYILVRTYWDELYLLRPVGWAGRWVPTKPRQAWGAPKTIWENSGTGQLAVWNMSSTGAYVSTGLIMSYPVNWTLTGFDATPNSSGFVFWRGNYDSYSGTDNRNKMAVWGLNSSGQISWGREYSVGSLFTTVGFVGDPSTNGFRMLHKRNADNLLILWNADATGLVTSSAWLPAIPSGWWLSSFKVSPNGKTWLYFRNSSDRSTAVWRISSTGAYEAGYVFGAMPDWDLVDISFSTSSEPYLWWMRKGDGAVYAWRCTTDGVFSASLPIQSAPGWNLNNVSSDFSTNGHTLFWIDQNNQLAVWNLNSAGVFQSGGTSGMVGAN